MYCNNILDMCLASKCCSAPAAVVGSGLAFCTPFPSGALGVNTLENTVESVLGALLLLSAAKPLHARTLDGSTIQRMGLETHAVPTACQEKSAFYLHVNLI